MNRLMRMMSIFMMSFALMLGNSKEVSATEISEYSLLLLEKYTVTDEKIVPGEDFTLTMTIKNYSKSKVTNVWIDVTNPSGVAPVYGEVSQAYVGDMEAGEIKEVSLDYNSWTVVYTDALDFYLSIRADQTSNYINMRIPVGTDSPFSILSTVLPTDVVEGEAVTASISFKTLGNENVRNVSMLLKENDNVLIQSSIGIMTPGASKTQSVSFTLHGLEQRSLQIVLRYDDEADQTQETVVAETTVNMKERVSQESGNTESTVNVPDEDINSNMAILGIGGILVLLFCILVMVIIKKK